MYTYMLWPTIKCLFGFRVDFFLVSQHVRQGTVSPTHYVSLGHDEEVWKIDHLQQLAYKLTHLYYNWPGTIRVPAPCQVFSAKYDAPNVLYFTSLS